MTDTMAQVNEILASDLPEVDKLVQAFGCIVNLYLEHGQGELDVLRAVGDQEELVKQQVKLSTLRHSEAILQRCYQLVTRRGFSDGQAEL